MTKQLTIFMSIITLIFMFGCKHSEPLFRNKVLIYSAQTKSQSNFYPNFFYVNMGDTLLACDKKFGYRGELRTRTGVPDSVASVIYQYVPSKSGKRINYTVIPLIEGVDTPKFTQYVLKKSDTCFVLKQNRMVTYDYSVTRYLKDTVINFYNNRIKCFMFYCNVDRFLGPGRNVNIVCLSKKDLIPIQITHLFYSNKNDLVPKRTNTYSLRYTISIDSVKSHEWTFF